MSVSLNAITSGEYKRICNPDLEDDVFEQVVRFVEECRDAGIQTRITFVDEYVDTDEARKLAQKLGVDVLIRPLMK